MLKIHKIKSVAGYLLPIETLRMYLHASLHAWLFSLLGTALPGPLAPGAVKWFSSFPLHAGLARPW